ncbi:c-type cytochrome [Rhizobium helianthi]|uniref:C-type cytochrome n=1 Tax=Rhizobium helianthi TaxID=1132695 RepID=A0ABW4LXF7_9HYPH
MMFVPCSIQPPCLVNLAKGLGFVLLMIVMCADPAWSADPVKGKRTFQQCASCHSIDTNSNGFGPSLKGILGRKAGALAEYSYSPAMKKAGEDGLVWDEAALAEFLSSPKKKVPGTSMRFFGLWFQSQIDDVIAYIKSAS